MDKIWSEMNKEMQVLITKKATLKDGMKKLLVLRKNLFEQIMQIVTTFPEEVFWQMPYARAEGYHDNITTGNEPAGDHPKYLGWVALERVLNQKPSV